MVMFIFKIESNQSKKWPKKTRTHFSFFFFIIDIFWSWVRFR